MCVPAKAAPPELESFAGGVGGVPSNHDVPRVCSTYGSPPLILSFFGSGTTITVPEGGIAFCGYGRDLTDVTAATGPLSASQSLGPILLGNPGFAGDFTGSAAATAKYKLLGAEAHDKTFGAPVEIDVVVK